MGRIPKAFSILLLLPVLAQAQTQPPAGKSVATPAAQVERIRLKLEKGEVGEMEILQMPEDLLTRTAITPDMLERQYTYKLTVRDLRSSRYRAELGELLKGTRVQPAAHRGDLRWGLIFHAPDGTRLGGLYVDADGRLGAVDGTAVSVDPDLHRWLKKSFGPVFR